MAGFNRHTRASARAIIGALLVLSIAAVGGAGSASANDDPHRVVVVNTPFTVPAAVCGFPINVGFPVNNEYQTITTLADHSTVQVITGSLTATFTNVDTQKTVGANISGPGTITTSPDGSTSHWDVRGLFNFDYSNAIDFGFPSNFFITSGQWSFDYNNTTLAMSNPSRHPTVVADICAELAP